jgi:hypothetical protein
VRFVSTLLGESEMKYPRQLLGLTASSGFLLLGVLALWGTRDMSPLGSVFPRAIGSAMILFAATDIVWNWFKPQREKLGEGSMPRRLMLVAIMLSWALLLQSVGFLVTSLGACLLLLLVANHDEWTPARAIGYVVGTIAVVGGLYSVFAFGLEVPLPKGILF